MGRIKKKIITDTEILITNVDKNNLYLNQNELDKTFSSNKMLLNNEILQDNKILSDNKISLNNEILDDNKILSDNNKILLDNKKINKSSISNSQEISYDLDIITINDFKKKEKMLYEVLNNFFNQCTLEEVQMIIQIIEGNHLISLRFLDWFVTRYCYLYKLSIPINNSYNKEQIFNINISYKAQLKSFKKRYFDPFRRKKKFNFWFDKHNLNILTTLGQLNFFRWALSYDVIKYAEKNYKEINGKMSHVNSYFKKNIIESNSLTITSSEEQTYTIDKKSISDGQTNFTSENSLTNDITYGIENKSKINKLSQNDIDILMDVNKCQNSIESNIYNYNKNSKPSKIFNELKKSQPTYKYPQVSRNICIEF